MGGAESGAGGEGGGKLTGSARRRVGASGTESGKWIKDAPDGSILCRYQTRNHQSTLRGRNSHSFGF